MLIGDDGTGVAAPALGWLHANCGITCHNSNSNSVGYGAGMDLRLDPTRLDGQSTAGFASRSTTVGVTVNAPNWNGRTRIVPGDPTASLLYQLISNRGMGNQMPPIATRVVDIDHVALVESWIRLMPAPPPPDAGAPPDAEEADAGAPDAGEVDAGEVDAGEPDAAAPDAAEPDAAPDLEPDAAEPDTEPPVLPDAGAPPDAEDASPDAGAPPDADVSSLDAGAPD
jgi:hypothetical protein